MRVLRPSAEYRSREPTNRSDIDVRVTPNRITSRFGDGETEFFFQNRRIAPKTGSLLLAPAVFTHTHRGNRPTGGDKYIATSWILFQPAEKLYAQPTKKG